MPTPLAVGFGEACAVAQREMERDLRHVERLSKRLYDGLQVAPLLSLGHVTRSKIWER